MDETPGSDETPMSGMRYADGSFKIENNAPMLSEKWFWVKEQVEWIRLKIVNILVDYKNQISQ